MEKLERNTDKKQECYERYHSASLQELEFKCYTLNSAVLTNTFKCVMCNVCVRYDFLLTPLIAACVTFHIYRKFMYDFLPTPLIASCMTSL